MELLWQTFHESHFWDAVELWTAARSNGEIADALLPEDQRLASVSRTRRIPASGSCAICCSQARAGPR